MQMYNCRHLRELEDELQQRGVLPAHETVFTHQLEALLKLAQGYNRLRQNQNLWRMFNTVNRWVPAWRYSANPGLLRKPRNEDASDFMNAVEGRFNLVRAGSEFISRRMGQGFVVNRCKP